MEIYNSLTAIFTDLHTHCNMSYAHGSLEDALKNALMRLDAVSVTGHAHWPDMPKRDGKIDHIIDFHEKGFDKLKKGWADDIAIMKQFNKEDDFIVFPGFEIHSFGAGDYTIVSKIFDMEILYPGSIDELRDLMLNDENLKNNLIPFPHHIGYKKGRRGINWDAFHSDVFPIVEIFSMHGCSEDDETERPFLHTMGPGTYYGSIKHGYRIGKKFGVIANTDHHSAHPGSYGHGITGVWAENKSREAIWNAIKQRRTFAMTTDKMKMKFTVNGAPMGSITQLTDNRKIEFEVHAGGTLDYIDIIKNDSLIKRYSQPDYLPAAIDAPFTTVLFLECGWGERNKPFHWDVQFSIDHGKIIDVDSRFRGGEVVSPLDKTDGNESVFNSQWEFQNEKGVNFTTLTKGNPTNSTPATQGFAMEIEGTLDTTIFIIANGKKYSINLSDLVQESFVAYTGGFDSPVFKLHRAPRPHEYIWKGVYEEIDSEKAYYYLRTRQKNGSLGWTSAVWVE
jgi:hypothetical protein